MRDVASEVNKIIKSYLEGNKKNAYSKLKKISKAYPANEKLRFNLAFMEQDQGDINSAKRNYIKLINEFNNFNSKINLYNIFLLELHDLSIEQLFETVFEGFHELDQWLGQNFLWKNMCLIRKSSFD